MRQFPALFRMLARIFFALGIYDDGTECGATEQREPAYPMGRDEATARPGGARGTALFIFADSPAVTAEQKPAIKAAPARGWSFPGGWADIDETIPAAVLLEQYHARCRTGNGRAEQANGQAKSGAARILIQQWHARLSDRSVGTRRGGSLRRIHILKSAPIISVRSAPFRSRKMPPRDGLTGRNA
jgi:hypothetical protein